ncbi:phospholipase D family protein [Qipengyuania sp. RANM35]|uniref:phospholipase D family protein n=1 Tax=Qipengyuania sp. RANM35 TaxID=3068635 RepID=UPI0034DAC0FC
MALVLVLILAALAVLGLTLKFANPLPARDRFPQDASVTRSDSSLVDRLAPLANGNPGKSAVMLLTTGLDAFAMRIAMVRRAEQTIDAQYYIWEDDLSGSLLLSEIVKAADRGVRVRVLIDDNPTAGLDPMWASVVTHPLIDVRIFNPMTIRRPRLANYLFDFPRLNRRMHNKSLTVDNAITVVGGRNVGDVYFGAASEGLFIDLDALTFGAIVPEVSAEFQRYWTSDAAYPAELILGGVEPERTERWRNPQFADSPLAQAYASATAAAYAELETSFAEGGFTWAAVELLADDPRKAEGRVREDELLVARLAPIITGARKRFDMISGYFVPASRGTEWLSSLARSGVTTRVVTNSVSVTDVPVVHAGYVPSRKPLVAAGVQLFELRPLGEDARLEMKQFGTSRFSGGGESLHAKTFAVDAQQLFVGSFNFDPRSALLNCEMGFVIESPELAGELVARLDKRLPGGAYKISARDDGELIWTASIKGQSREYRTEPGTSALGRFLIWALSKLPIAWLL